MPEQSMFVGPSPPQSKQQRHEQKQINRTATRARTPQPGMPGVTPYQLPQMPGGGQLMPAPGPPGGLGQPRPITPGQGGGYAPGPGQGLPGGGVQWMDTYKPPGAIGGGPAMVNPGGGLGQPKPPMDRMQLEQQMQEAMRQQQLQQTHFPGGMPPQQVGSNALNSMQGGMPNLQQAQQIEQMTKLRNMRSPFLGPGR